MYRYGVKSGQALYRAQIGGINFDEAHKKPVDTRSLSYPALLKDYSLKTVLMRSSFGGFLKKYFNFC